MRRIIPIIAFIWGLLTFWLGIGNTYARQTQRPGISIKTNVLSPFFKSLSFEVEVKPKKRISYILVFGKRAFEGIGIPTIDPCLRQKSAGIGMGCKYFLICNSPSRNSVTGISLKPMVTYDFRTDIERQCPVGGSELLFQTHYWGGHILLAVQKTYFDRILIEGQAGIGYLIFRGNAKGNVPVGAHGWEAGNQFTNPIGLNLGINF